MESIVEQVNNAFSYCGVFVRDTNLAPSVLAKYGVGLLLREPTFCDASYKVGGFVAPHRFLIISATARCLDEIAPQPWGLCVWQRGRVFKVIDKVSEGEKVQITLLEVPEELLEIFCHTELNDIEEHFVEQARETFGQYRLAEPLPELNNDQWRDRLLFPLGIDDDGRYFPLFDIDTYKASGERARIAKILQYLANVYLSMGFYVEATSMLRELIEAESPFEDAEILGGYLMTLGRLYLQIGSYKDAEASLHEAFKLFKAGNENRLKVAVTLHLLGQAYHGAGAYSEAERNYKHALEIKRSVAGERSLEIVSCLVSLGALYEATGRYEEAESCLKEALQVESENGREAGPTLFNNLARLQQAMGRFPEALSSIQKAVSLDEAGAREGRQQVNLLYNLAEIYAAVGRASDARHSMLEALESERQMISEVVSACTERQRVDMLSHLRLRVDQYISLVLAFFPQNERALSEVVDLILERKALGADLFALQRDAVLSGRYPHLESRLQELFDLRSSLAERLLAGSGHGALGQSEDLSAMVARREALEVELARDIPEMRLEKRLRKSDLSTVIKAIPSDSALFEFFRFEPFDFTAVRSQGSTPHQPAHYLGIALSPHTVLPCIIDLGDAFEIDRKVSDWRSLLIGEEEVQSRQFSSDEEQENVVQYGWMEELAEIGQRLRRLIFDPLFERVGDCKHLFISPDGDLWRLPFEALPFAEGKLLIDDLQISYLSVGRDMLRFGVHSEQKAGQPLVIAAPDFNLASEVQSENMGAESLSKVLHFDDLPGTAQEGHDICHMLNGRPLFGREALKSRIKMARSPKVLHIATHGFVLGEKRDRALSGDEFEVGMVVKPIDHDRELMVLDGILATPIAFSDPSQSLQFARLSGVGLENPLLRSGLALAGANIWLRGGSLPKEAENGILTAEDVTGLDLSATELVVLSACETGLGEVHAGEGVFGLRRSFALAGARTLVCSLWKVPDHHTQILMADFYNRLLAGSSIPEALRAAQLSLKEVYVDPFYWAAFICQGDPAPLEGIYP